ncbi:MAG: imidazoleglycerol-phosphate dehydratase [Thaumarchaeota archaeon]|nr:imidazoleglycerol-phosphate dehydratase [Nitrososphaerota archaeon]
MKSRIGNLVRKTKETEVSVNINLDGSGRVNAKTGLPFLDHLVVSFAKHAMFDLKLNAVSRDGIDHHLVEDTAIALGNAVDESLGSRTGITRFGYSSVPMDEALADASLDLVKRQYHMIGLGLKRDKVEGISREDLEHFFRSLAQSMNVCVHISVKYGDNDHHKIEAAIKALAVALRVAASADKRQKGPPSTKGVM